MQEMTRIDCGFFKYGLSIHVLTNKRKLMMYVSMYIGYRFGGFILVVAFFFFFVFG